MAVIIPHSTEELRLYKLQKEFIQELFEEDRIIYAAFPFWIECTELDITKTKMISKVELEDIQVNEKCIYYPVCIDYDGKKLKSRLPLIILHSGPQFTEIDRQKIAQKKQPVKLLKVFRLGIVQDEGPHAKSISKSVWCKIK